MPWPTSPPLPNASHDWMIWNPLPRGSDHGSMNAKMRRSRYGAAREDQQRQHEPLEPAMVEAERAPQACGAEHGPEALLLEEKVRVVEPVGGHDRARGVDHHDAG